MGHLNMNSSHELMHGNKNPRLLKVEIDCLLGCVPPLLSDSKGQKIEETRDSNGISTCQSGTSVVDQSQSPVDAASPSSAAAKCQAPLCRQFWKAGSYMDEFASKATFQGGKNYALIHPRFLHSNATSHKWAFGAIAELIDNAFDEIKNGAKAVILNEIKNPRDGSPALLIQDNGGGMGPDEIRCCMNFGFSNKDPELAIGKYGNGFKTSSMRLGADVIVFTRVLGTQIGSSVQRFTQSIGLLSYSFLTQSGYDRIVVPMVDYEFSDSVARLEPLLRKGVQHFESNLSLILRWSPYSTQEELLNQFINIGCSGTKVIIYNLWHNNEGETELDFLSDRKDILLRSGRKKSPSPSLGVKNEYVATRLRYSLRAYLSILYLKIPQDFQIILCGREVKHHNIADDLQLLEFIYYQPHSAGKIEGRLVATIGFLKGAPRSSTHGFNLYHKNRLIMPFWPVVRSGHKCKGIVGALEANMVEPTHNKQEFEKTSLFQKLETRLKEMTTEYWDFHCEDIGQSNVKKIRISGPMSKKPPAADIPQGLRNIAEPPVPAEPVGCSQQGLGMAASFSNDADSQSKRATQQPEGTMKILLRENSRLHAECLAWKRKEHLLNEKVVELRGKLERVKKQQELMFAEMLA